MRRLNPQAVYLIMQGAAALAFKLVFTANMIYQVSRVGLDSLQLVLVGTTLELTVFLFEVPTGVVADVYSRRLSVIVGFFVIGLGFLVEGSVPVFAAVLTAQVLWGLGYTFTSGATQAWIVDEIGEKDAGAIFLRGAQVSQLCGLAGIAVSAAVGSLRINWPILAGGALFLGLGLFLLAAMPERGFHPAPVEQRSSWRAMGRTLRDGAHLVRVHPALMTILGIGLFYGLFSEGYDRLSTAHILKDMTLPPVGHLAPVVWIGLMSAAGTLLTAAATGVVRRRLDTSDAAAVVRAMSILSAALLVGLIIFALAGNFAVAVLAVWTVGVTRNLIGPLYDAWINQRLDSQVRATVNSLGSQMDALGQIAGGPPVGAIGTLFSIRAALLASGLLLSPVLLLLARAARPGAAPPALAEARLPGLEPE